MECSRPSSYSSERPPANSHKNHSNAIFHRRPIEKFIDKELEGGDLVGPFMEDPFKLWFKVSLMMTRPKRCAIASMMVVEERGDPHHPLPPVHVVLRISTVRVQRDGGGGPAMG